MEKSWRNSTTVRALSAIMTILMLWLTIVCVCCTVLCLAAGYYSNPLDINEVVLKNHTQTQAIASYYQVYRASIESFESKQRYQNSLSHYDNIFNPEQTNLRFVVTDSHGNSLLSNDPNYDKAQSLLTSYTEDYAIPTASQRYENIVHFDNYESLMSANLLQYLDNPDDFSCWFFADDEVDAMRSEQFPMEVTRYEVVATHDFKSTDEALKMDLKQLYGEDCKLSTQAYGLDDIRVTVRSPQTQIVNGTLNEYFYYKSQENVSVRATDMNFDQKIKNGLDITIVGIASTMEPISIRTYLPQNMTVKDDISEDVALMKVMYQLRKLFLVGCFVFATITIAACIVLCTTAGHVRGTEKIAVSRIHHIGFEIFWLLPVLAAAATFIITFIASKNHISWSAMMMLGGGLIFVDAASIILLIYSIAIRSKVGTFWSSFFFVRIITHFYFLFNNKVTACLVAALYCFFLFFINVSLPRAFSSSLINLLIIAVDFFTLLLIFYIIYGYFELRRRVNNIVQGKLQPTEPPIPLVLDFAEFSKSLDNMTGGIQSIVEQQTRAERMRTELITNVSHDLKTPLTSIVNYTDLLSREPMQTEHATEYLEVLKRQSARLRKLTEDLVDASKASSGTLSVDLQPMELQVLIPQLACEYEDKLAARDLTLVTAFPDEPVMILADGRHLFRVLSNLLGNACKYSMSASRIYLDVIAKNGIAEIIIKNISEHALNVTPDELTERFVRGDASRHTEGSGLGLSIAKDLARLQGGELSIGIDGDLFKAIVRFPQYTP